MPKKKIRVKKAPASRASRRATRLPRTAALSRRRKSQAKRPAGTDPKRVRAILEKLDEAYPAVTCALEHKNPFQLLIATILSAQTTDTTVNQVTPALFAKYPTPKDLAYANPNDVEQVIRRTGFFRNKTKSIIGTSKKIVEEYHGEVPRTIEELLTLPGVARKTANVVLGTAYGIPSGVVVDTHVQRLAGRLDLSRNTDPKKIEQDLMRIIPQEKWILFSHQLIWHGRRVCQARKPLCIQCNLVKICYSKDKTV
ncbi:MAG: endonuclease III [Candidatus Acidiferrales bacterium]|jgi:endonuclease-3